MSSPAFQYGHETLTLWNNQQVPAPTRIAKLRRVCTCSPSSTKPPKAQRTRPTSHRNAPLVVLWACVCVATATCLLIACLQRLREELKEIALKRCDDSVAKFAACAREKGMLVVFSCREQNALSESYGGVLGCAAFSTHEHQPQDPP